MNKPDPSSASVVVRTLPALIRWRRFLFLTTFVGTLLTIGIAFVLPVRYIAVASVFAPEKTDFLSGLGGIPSISRSLAAASPLFKTNPELDKYMAIVKSTTVLRKIIDKFDLIREYDATTYPYYEATKELLDNVEFSVEPENYLKVSVYDKSPVKAAEMANYFITLLDSVNADLSIQGARATRTFVEARYARTREELRNAEDSLRVFQQKYGIVALPEQMAASVKAAAELASRLAVKEIEYAVMKQSLGESNTALEQLELEIHEMNGKMSEMNAHGMPFANGQSALLPLGNIPNLGMEYFRRFREVEIQTKILQFITPLFEQAKVEEQRQSPPVLVLDRGIPAERKSKPKRMLIALAGLFISLAGAGIYAGASEYWERERDAHSLLYERLLELRDGIRADVLRIRSRLRRGRR